MLNPMKDLIKYGLSNYCQNKIIDILLYKRQVI